VAIGLIVGLGITAAAEKAFRAYLPALTSDSAEDTWTAIVLVFATAALACWLPSRKRRWWIR
jgi:ABC-type lipoprotein release transport system permease subunit